MANTKNTRDSQNSPNEPDERQTADERLTPMEVLRNARAQLAELTGMNPESVSSFEQTETAGPWRSRSSNSPGCPTR